jgi:hypothetical protein
MRRLSEAPLDGFAALEQLLAHHRAYRYAPSI